jgi:hypothetical protein
MSATGLKKPSTWRSRIATRTIRLRDEEHRRFVSTQPCLVCGRSPADARHLRFAQSRALGRKVSDEFTVPVCRVHHRELPRHGDDVSWWKRIDLDPLPIALKLWQHTRRNGTAVIESEDKEANFRAPTIEARLAQSALTSDHAADVQDPKPIRPERDDRQ